MFERGLQRQAKACPCRYTAGRGRVGEEGKEQEGGGGPAKSRKKHKALKKCDLRNVKER